MSNNLPYQAFIDRGYFAVKESVFETPTMTKTYQQTFVTESGILSGGNRFEKAYSFKNGELTCLLFPFEDIQLDVRKLAIWRLRTREDFGSAWLSDYVENSLGGYISEQSETEEMEMEMG